MSAAYKPILVVLAAGQSRRFKGIKVLANIGGHKQKTTMLQSMLSRISEFQHPILIATGAYHSQISECVENKSMLFQCTKAHLGMGHTMCQATQFVKRQNDKFSHIVFILADQVALSREEIQKILVTAQDSPENIIYSATKFGISAPAIFPTKYWPELEALAGDTGAKNIILNNIDDAIAVDAENAHIDIDRQEQLIQWNEKTEVIHDHT